MDRTEKEKTVASLNEIFSSTAVVIVTQNAGLTVSQLTDLRRKMREAGASFKVTKNRLTKLAIRGTPYESLSNILTGPTAIAYSNDVVAPARVASKFAKANDRLIIIGGAMGQTELDESGVKALAELPSLDELRGKLVGLLQAPATKIAGILQAPAGQLARVFGAYGSKDAA
ncbi:MAG: 50S ribosomal protein L10 [Proteobacteria bacterium]|nr:50S ribosomal protein L10 [Pseudomonadota bacterium]MDA1059804.1 50S ribosomal protein L10 [Pseudomonadota bacterium]